MLSHREKEPLAEQREPRPVVTAEQVKARRQALRDLSDALVQGASYMQIAGSGTRPGCARCGVRRGCLRRCEMCWCAAPTPGSSNTAAWRLADSPASRALIDGTSFIQIADCAEIDHPVFRSAAALSGIRTVLFVPLRKDDEFLRPISAGAHRAAYARAEACFRRAVANGKAWSEVR